MKETFIIRTEWWDAISELNLNDQALIFRLLFEYHLGKPINNLNNLSVKLVWKLIEPNLQRNVEYYDKRRFTSIENGKKGGRPSKPKKNLKKPKKPLSDSDTDNNIKIDTNVSTKEKSFEDNSISLKTEIETKGDMARGVTPNLKEQIDWGGLLHFINQVFERQFRVINKKSKVSYLARIKEGYTKEDILKAITNCKKNPFHIDSRFEYCTPEYFSRANVIDRYSQESTSNHHKRVDHPTVIDN